MENIHEHFEGIIGSGTAIGFHLLQIAPIDTSVPEQLITLAMNAAMTGIIGGACGYMVKLLLDKIFKQ